MRLFLSCFSLLLALAGVGRAAETVEMTVSAGKHDRVNEPVYVPLNVGLKVPVNANVEIKDEKGGVVAVGQLTFSDLVTDSIKPTTGKSRLDLCFVLPELKSGQTANLKAVLSDTPRKASKDEFVFHGEADGKTQWTELRLGSRPVWRYMHTPWAGPAKDTGNPTSKVFHHLYDPAGQRLVTNGAEGKFPHHRGLYYGFSKTSYGKNTVDIWHCRGDVHQAHSGFAVISTGPVIGRHTLEVDWNGVGKKTFAKEQRELTAYNVPGGTLIDFVSRLTPTGDPVKVDGDPQHAGFHFRAAQDVEKKNARQTIFIRSDGTDKPGATRNWDPKGKKDHINLPWLAMSFVVGDKRYTAAYLDRPDNPKEARFSERDYGRFGSYFVAEATKQKPLVVRYRVWLQEGQMKPDEVKAKSVAFVEPVEVRVK